MLGGFLGSGKTTTLLRLAQQLQRAGKRVGIITNDQAAGLVDTALMEELNLPVSEPKRSGDTPTFRPVSIGEIAGGCFCCRSGSLVEALGKLTAASQPEVFLAEPVGSCTDLVATVSLPLERIYNAGERQKARPFRTRPTPPPFRTDGTDFPTTARTSLDTRRGLENPRSILLASTRWPSAPTARSIPAWANGQG